MHLTTFLLAAAAASLSAAQSTPKCEAQQVLDTCVSRRQPMIDSCPPADYGCLCEQYTNLLICYNTCPDDPNRSTASQQKTQNCGAASAYGTSSTAMSSGSASGRTSASATTTSSSGATSETSADAASSDGGQDNGSSGGSNGDDEATAGAAALTVEMAGGMLAVVAVGFGLFL